MESKLKRGEDERMNAMMKTNEEMFNDKIEYMKHELDELKEFYPENNEKKELETKKIEINRLHDKINQLEKEKQELKDIDEMDCFFKEHFDKLQEDYNVLKKKYSDLNEEYSYLKMKYKDLNNHFQDYIL
jgi:uncharacterized protein YPO0396